MNCTTKYCRNEARKGKKICYKCASKKYKERHPENYFFNALRNNARRRGKEFIISLNEFREFCERTAYMELKGKTADSLSIDRINNEKGYSIDNIQAISLRYNSQKQKSDREERLIDVPF